MRQEKLQNPEHAEQVSAHWILPLAHGLRLTRTEPGNSLAPECLNKGFALTHTPFIPPTAQKLNPWLAALEAQNIRTALDRHREYPVIWVPNADAQRAQTELQAYERINANWPKHQTATEPNAPLCSDNAFAASLLIQAAMLKFFLWLNQTGQDSAWKRRGTWNPQDIASGEWWRCVTALTLHADLTHVTANLLWGFILGCLTATRIGTGYAILLMVAAGTLGNATMLWLGSQHQSLGESTMIFGLLGIMAAQLTVTAWKQKENGRGLIRLIPGVPSAFALAITALYGAAPGTDALAHLCGLACGLALGAIPELTPTLTHDTKAQTLMGLAAIASIPLAWYLAWT